MKRTDSILQQFYMSELPKAQTGLNSSFSRCPEGYAYNEDTGKCQQIVTLPEVVVQGTTKRKDLYDLYGGRIGWDKPRMGDFAVNNKLMSRKQLEDQAELRRLGQIKRLREKQGTITQGDPDAFKPQPWYSKAWEMMVNPLDAWGYSVRGQKIPDNFSRRGSSPLNTVTQIINPAAWVDFGVKGAQDVGQGTYNIAEATVKGEFDRIPNEAARVGLGALGVAGAVYPGARIARTAAPAAKAIGKTIVTKTPVRNAWRLNPRAVNLEKEVAKNNLPIRQIYGDEAFESFKRYGPSVQPGVSQADQLAEFAKLKSTNVLNFGTGETMQIANTGSSYPFPYFSQGSKWYGPKSGMSNTGTERLIVPKAGSNLTFYPAGEQSIVMNFDELSPKTISSYAGKRRVLAPFEGFDNPANFDLYQGTPHWWKGYRKINVSEPISGVDDLGIYNQVGDKKYYTLGEGFGDIGTAQQQKANFINKLSDSEYSDYVSKLSNAEKRKLYGLPPYDIDKSILDNARRSFLEMQRSGQDVIHPFIRNTNWRNLGDEFRGVMRQWGLEPTSQKDVEKFRQLWIKDQFSKFNTSQRNVGFGDAAVYLNNPLIKNKEGGPIVDPRGQWAYPGRDTIVPTASGGITMQDVPYPVYGEDETGYGQMMMPGGEYQFPGQMVYEKPMMESGGQHGGLDRWFAEKWVDVKTGKACGRQEGEKRRSYPACRPSRRVSEDTPKTSGELSSSEREKFKRSKTSSERINYQHRRKEYGGETNEQDMANKPNNPSLWSKAKSLAKQKFDVYPSAYANGWAAKWYKGKGGTWRKAEYGMEIPYMEDGGIPDNEGFRALPPKVQQQIIDNMAFGGYIPEMGYGGAAQQAAIAIAMKKAGKKPKMPFGGLMLPGIKKRIEEAKPMLMQMAPMLMGAPPMPMMQQGGEPDGSMALGQINAAMDKLEKLRQFIQPDSDLEPWVSSKLTLLDHYTDAVSDYMMYNPEATGAQEEVPMEEMRDGGIPQRYKNMGFTKVGVKKNSTRPGKKWMVLAKKGSDYKVVHGGYDGMKDFSQHGSEQRKENFWNRMGGKNSSKATDPFSPLYWHKRFGTWENGGQPFLPQAQDGKMLLPKEQDFPDYETYAAALDQYLASLNPVQGDTAAVVQQQAPVAAPTTDQKSPFVLKPYEGSSIYDFMVTQGKAPEYSSRKQLAKDLGIENYRGTAEQNLSMLDMLRSSPDKLSTYTPVSESKKVASATNNNKPSEAQEAQPKPQPKKQNPAPPKLETQTEDDYVNEIAATVLGLATIGGLGIAEARQALRNIEEGKYNLSGKAKAKLTKAVNSLKSQSLASSGEKVKEVSKWYNSLPARQKNILKSLDLAEISGDIANTRPGTALKNVEAYNMLQEAKQEDAVLDAMKAAEEAKALRSFNAQKAAAVRWGKPVPTFPKLAPIASETKAGASIFKEGLNAAMETPWLRNSIKFMKRLPLRFQEGGESVPDDDSFLENAAEWLDPTGISSWDDVARTFNDPNSGAFDRFLSVAGALPIIGKIGKGAKVVSLASDGAKAMSKTKKVTNAVGKGLDIITLTKPQRWIDNKVNPFTRAFGAMTSKAGANLPRAAAVPANILVDIGRSNRAWNAVDNFIPGGTSMVRIAPQGEVVNLITPDGRLISTTTADPRVRQLYDQNLIDTTQGGYDEKTSGWRLKSGSPYGNYDYFKKSGGSTWYNNTFYQKGGSIVDYLASKGMAYDKESRKKLAEKMGIKDYNFSANKNLELLAALRQELKDSPSSKNVKSSKSTSELLSAPSMLRARPTFTPDPINFTQSVLSHMNSDKQLESGFVVDKRTNMGHVVKDGKIQESFPVLTGSNPEGTENPYSVAYLDNNPSNRVTPAGTYNMIPSSRKDRGNKSGTIYGAPGYFLQPVAAFNQKAPNSKNVAIHTTYDPASRDELYTMSPADRYASYGCINCKPKNIGDLTSKYFPQGDTLMVLDPQKNMYDFDFMDRLQQGKGLIKKAGGEIEEGDILEVTPAQAKALREAGFEFTTE